MLASGLDLIVVAPGGLQPSPHTLCAFAHELPPALISRRYEHCAVLLGEQRIALPAFARVDTAAVAAVDVDVVDGVVVAADAAGVVFIRDGGTERIAARAVVDCAGSGGVVQRDGEARCFQTALGWRVRGRDAGLGAGTALFMDWSRADDVDDEGGPSFLYALVDDDGTLLLEETALAARPAASFDVLRARLERRLRRRGTVIEEVIAEERVHIPLDLPLPRRGQSMAAFGLAAGMVHPTTGFQIASAIARADAVADAVVAHLDEGPVGVADAVLDTLWTPERRAARALQLFALEVAVGLDDNAAAAAFFRAFFAQPGALSWLSSTASPSQLRRILLAMFADAPWSLRARLVGGAPALPSLLRALWPSPLSFVGASI